jgi:hypothetical protein
MAQGYRLKDGLSRGVLPGHVVRPGEVIYGPYEAYVPSILQLVEAPDSEPVAAEAVSMVSTEVVAEVKAPAPVPAAPVDPETAPMAAEAPPVSSEVPGSEADQAEPLSEAELAAVVEEDAEPASAPPPIVIPPKEAAPIVTTSATVAVPPPPKSSQTPPKKDRHNRR